MSDTTMRRYLLAELSEREQADLEARYFQDPRVFDELVETETALVDDYVRGRLTPEARRRFETAFMADPRRRDRVRFAEALITAIDRPAAPEPHGRAQADARATTGIAAASWRDRVRTPRFALAMAGVFALVVIGTWLVLNPRRASEEAAGPVPPTVPAAPAPGPPRAGAIATLALVVGPGQRSGTAGEPPTLTIPPGMEQVRLALTVREDDYAEYRVFVRPIGGADVLRQGDLHTTPGGTPPAFTITAPAASFASGDYLLTLQGATSDGAYEDLSQTIFRVVRIPGG